MNVTAVFLLKLALLLPLACGTPALALDADIPLRDLNHTSWGDKDGVANDVFTMAQTRDGWLWLGTQNGLYRFDGVRLHRLPLKKNRILHLYAADNGDLLISYLVGGLSILHADGRLRHIDGPADPRAPISLVVASDGDGTLWTVGGMGVYRYRDGQWRNLGPFPTPLSALKDVLRDQYGRIWASGETGVYLVDRERELVDRVDAGPGGMLTQSPDGRIWVSNRDHLRAVPMPPVARPLPRGDRFNQSGSRWAGQFDRDGNLWAPRCPQGLCRLRPRDITTGKRIDPARQASDRLDQYWQLSSPSVNEVLEDREGNIWIATASGLDRLRENQLRPSHIPTPQGAFSMATDSEGRLWVADYNNGAVWTVSPRAAPLRQPGRSAWILVNDRDGALLLAGKRDIERIHQGRSSKIALPMVNGERRDLRVFGMLDDGKVLWMVAHETGLMAWSDGRWRPRSEFNLPTGITTSAAGRPGQLWLGHRNGKLELYDEGRISRFDSSAVGVETAIFAGPPTVVAGERGIAVLRGGGFALLGEADVEALQNITGMATTPNGDRWFNGNKGVVRVRKDDWEAALRAPARPLKYQLLDALEGYVGRAAMLLRLPTVAHAGDGRLWLLGSAELMLLDTAAIKPGRIRPAAHIMELHSGGASHPVDGPLTLPPDSRDFSIAYSTPALRKPEGMRFQYKLDGADTAWVDAGARRTAYYTNIGPGRYLFQVRAIGEDGLASETPAALAIEVAPTVPQSWWFRLLCALALLGAGAALYRHRLRAAMAQAARQVLVRTDERERIARTLHDTFLQSVYALIVQVYALVLKLPEGSESRRKLKAILDLANSTIDEGRAQLQQLRGGDDDAERLLGRVGESMARLHAGTSFQLIVEGERRKLAAAAREELGGIGREALHNAFRHAAAGHVSARFEYGADALTLRIVDDGRGFEHGRARPRDGHWGLVGMRERARRAGGQLRIVGGPGAGTSVECSIPGRLAYAAE